ncbi:hypothetical protein CTAYLR_008708 [Chrysophaeum taylorii]|uniref:Calcineurin-like phosphoesterase domain-containing protein n=1 Tax=Chrysophaeum taylorii TaxID=2483200 RepID=A0AAD7XPM3_9STRA|nr:hypothetical protein CTAYLR_008708 [Chrysophaeum taylorii]
MSSSSSSSFSVLVLVWAVVANGLSAAPARSRLELKEHYSRILIDGDNVRGKSGFRATKDSLLGAVSQWASAGLESPATVYYDHGPRADAFERNDVRVVFSGPRLSADDAIARDVRYVLERSTLKRIAVVTSDTNLVTRCKRAARGLGRVDFIKATALAKALDLDVELLLQTVEPSTRGDDLEWLHALAQRAKDTNLFAEPLSPEELVLECEASELAKAIFANGGGAKGKEETWERVLHAGKLFSDLLSNECPDEDFRRHVRKEEERWRRKRERDFVPRWHWARYRISPGEQWPGGWTTNEPGSLTLNLAQHEPNYLPHIVRVNCPEVKNDVIRVVVTSDTHGLEIPEAKGDLVIHAGDFALDSRNKIANAAALEAFNGWLEKFPAGLVVRGNHDPVRAKLAAPYATEPTLYDFVFAKSSMRVLAAPHGSYRHAAALVATVGHVDLVVSHAPPAGVLDATYSGYSAGSKTLRRGLEQAFANRSLPALWICGHIHESAGLRVRDGVLVLNAAAANPGRAVELVRPPARLDLKFVDHKNNPKTKNVDQMAPTEKITQISLEKSPEDRVLLAVDLGATRVGVAAYDHSGALVAYASAADPAAAVASMKLDSRPALVAAEGSRALCERAMNDLAAAGLVAAKTAEVVDAGRWRADLLTRKECRNAPSSKEAAHHIAEQFIFRSRQAFRVPSLDAKLTTDAADAICFGAWAAANLNWTPLAPPSAATTSDPRRLVQRYSNGNIIRPRATRECLPLE